jgi:hypothetical protein
MVEREQAVEYGSLSKALGLRSDISNPDDYDVFIGKFYRGFSDWVQFSQDKKEGKKYYGVLQNVKRSGYQKLSQDDQRDVVEMVNGSVQP